MTAVPRAPTSPRLRGEVDLRALLREASRVRGHFQALGLADKPPHPDSVAPLRVAWNPTSPRKRGEVWRALRARQQAAPHESSSHKETRGEAGA